MLNNAQILGQIGEKQAVMFLVKHRFRILCRNYRKRAGEIDIVAEKNNIIHFIEVKSVSRVTFAENHDYLINFGDSHRPEDNVDRRKIAKLEKMSQIFMMEQNIKDKELQIDLITVIFTKGNSTPTLEYLENVNL